MRAESAVEPTRSENINVTWRRSARSSGGALGQWTWSLRQRKAPYRSPCYAEQRWHPAASHGVQTTRRQAPSGARESGSGEPSRLCHSPRKIASYLPRPMLRSQSTMSIGTPPSGGDVYYLPRCLRDKDWTCSATSEARAESPLCQSQTRFQRTRRSAHWIGGPTTSWWYFLARARSVSASTPCRSSITFSNPPGVTPTSITPHVLEGVCGASRNEHRGLRRRAHDAVAKFDLKLTAHDVVDDLTYVQVTCLACAQAYLVNPKNGKVLGSDDE